MALDKNSYQSDAIVNLYRAALYIARGYKETGMDFYQKAKKVLGKRLEFSPDFQRDNLYVAEKILDQYFKLRSV